MYVPVFLQPFHLSSVLPAVFYNNPVEEYLKLKMQLLR